MQRVTVINIWYVLFALLAVALLVLLLARARLHAIAWLGLCLVMVGAACMLAASAAPLIAGRRDRRRPRRDRRRPGAPRPCNRRSSRTSHRGRTLRSRRRVVPPRWSPWRIRHRRRRHERRAYIRMHAVYVTGAWSG